MSSGYALSPRILWGLPQGASIFNFCSFWLQRNNLSQARSYLHRLEKAIQEYPVDDPWFREKIEELQDLIGEMK